MSTVTLTDLIAKVRRRARIEESSFITSSQSTVTDVFIIEVINEAAAYLHQHLAQSSEDYYITKALLTVANGAITADLPADFFKIRSLDKMIGGDGYRSLEPFTLPERNDYRGWGALSWYQEPRYNLAQDKVEFIPDSFAPGQYLLRYTPTYQPLTSGSDQVSFPEEWHNYVVVYAAIQCLMYLSLPSDELQAHLGRLERTIVRGAARRGQPRRMLNLRERRRW